MAGKTPSATPQVNGDGSPCRPPTTDAISTIDSTPRKGVLKIAHSITAFLNGNNIFLVISKAKIFILVFWFTAVCACIYWAPQFFSATTSSFSPPPGSYSAKANEVYNSIFGNAQPDLNVVMIEKVTDGQLDEEFVTGITYQLYADVQFNFVRNISIYFNIS